MLPQRIEERKPIIPLPVVGQGRLRKIALVGSAQTVQFTPWWDPTWEIWAHATVHPYCQRVDRYFDLHPWKWISEKPKEFRYLEWLKDNPTPIYMQRVFREVPASIRYPKERILAEYPRYFTSHVAWMIALALSEGVTHLGFYGIHYALDEEHKKQRAGCEFWMGIAEGKGVKLIRPPGCPLIAEPSWLYGYESHDGKQHVRTKTGGKRPTRPPQNVSMTEVADPTVETLRAGGRTDIPFAAARVAAQLAGQPPMLHGRPAW